MTITFENNNDVIVYALEKIIAHARRTQQVFVAQCVWWLVSIIGLEQGLVNYIDTIQSRQEIIIIPGKARKGRKRFHQRLEILQETKDRIESLESVRNSWKILEDYVRLLFWSPKGKPRQGELILRR